MCSAKRHVRFAPNSDRKSGFPQNAMSALPLKADMCGALGDVRFVPKADMGGAQAHVRIAIRVWIRERAQVQAARYNRTRETRPLG